MPKDQLPVLNEPEIILFASIEGPQKKSLLYLW